MGYDMTPWVLVPAVREMMREEGVSAIEAIKLLKAERGLTAAQVCHLYDLMEDGFDGLVEDKYLP